jgi:hypothetical protein
MKKLVSIFIAISLMAALILSCAEQTDSGDSAVTTAAETEPEMLSPEESRKAIPDNLPDRKFDGYKFTVLARNRDDFVQDIGAGSEETGDVIDDAIYKRNSTVEERFDIVIDASHTADPITMLRQSVLAKDEAYDIMLSHVIECGSAALEGNYLDWYEDLPYVNLEQPWYIGNAVDALSVKNHAYIMAGEYCLSILRFTYCMYFNKDIATNNNVGDLYGIVMNNAWTIDAMAKTIKDVYQDIDGDGSMTDKDLYGFTSDYYSAAITYQYAFDNPVMTKNSEGIPELTFNSSKLPELVDKIYSLFYENPGSYVGDWGISMPIWREARALFLNGLFSQAESYRDLEFDFGIIPYPKWDEAQESYYTMSDGAHDVMAVPVTCSDPERTSIIVEALNAESYKQVIPAYYETALKVKYTRDEESVQVLDTLLAGRTFDFGYVYDGWQGLAFMLQNLTSNKSKDYASEYKRLEKGAMVRYNKVIDTLLGLEE